VKCYGRVHLDTDASASAGLQSGRPVIWPSPMSDRSRAAHLVKCYWRAYPDTNASASAGLQSGRPVIWPSPMSDRSRAARLRTATVTGGSPKDRPLRASHCAGVLQTLAAHIAESDRPWGVQSCCARRADAATPRGLPAAWVRRQGAAVRKSLPACCLAFSPAPAPLRYAAAGSQLSTASDSFQEAGCRVLHQAQSLRR
jgi:hypothetical protein